MYMRPRGTLQPGQRPRKLVHVLPGEPAGLDQVRQRRAGRAAEQLQQVVDQTAVRQRRNLARHIQWL
jgi:hypothetical protein